MTEIEKLNKLKTNIKNKPNWHIEKSKNTDFKYRVYHKYDKKAIDFEIFLDLLNQEIKFKSSKMLNVYLFKEVLSVIKHLYSLFSFNNAQTIELATLNGRLAKLKQQHEIIEELEKDYQTNKNLLDAFQLIININEKPHLLTQNDLISIKTSEPTLAKIKQQLNQQIKTIKQQIDKIKKEETNNEN